jgi:hypothetical protein
MQSAHGWRQVSSMLHSGRRHKLSLVPTHFVGRGFQASAWTPSSPRREASLLTWPPIPTGWRLSFWLAYHPRRSIRTKIRGLRHGRQVRPPRHLPGKGDAIGRRTLLELAEAAFLSPPAQPLPPAPHPPMRPVRRARSALPKQPAPGRVRRHHGHKARHNRSAPPAHRSAP